MLGGTGMLTGVADALLADGWQVVLPSRRRARIAGVRAGPGRAARAALRRPGHRPTVAPSPDGRAIWVAADWTRPDELAADAGRALGGPADLLVAWVHYSYRDAVLAAVAELVAPGAPVVEVWRRGTGDQVSDVRDPVLAGHPTQQVVLGHVWQSGRARWLTHAEIMDAVLVAVRRALAGQPTARHEIGQSLPRPPHR